MAPLCCAYLQHGLWACRGLRPLDPWGLHPSSQYVVYPSCQYIVYPSSQHNLYPSSLHIVYPSSQYIFYSSESHTVYPSQQYIFIPVSHSLFIPVSSPFFILASHIFLSQSATHSFSHFYIFQFYILISFASRTQITQVRSSSCQFFHLFIISIPFRPKIISVL